MTFEVEAKVVMGASNYAFERPVSCCTSARGQRAPQCAPSARLWARRSAAQRERYRAGL